MAYGLRVYNDISNDLTFSDSGLVYSYIGKASLSSVVQASGDTVVRIAGYSLYTIEWAGDIVVGLGLTTANSAVWDTSRSGNTWTIKVSNSTGTPDSYGFIPQVAADVYVFGVSLTATGYGISIYDDSQNLLCVASKPPMAYKELIVSDGRNTNVTLAYTKPVIIGACMSSKLTSTQQGTSSSYEVRLYAPAWSFSANTLIPVLDQSNYNVEDFIAPVTVFRPSYAIMFEGDTL